MNELASVPRWTGAAGLQDYYIEATKSLVERSLRTLKHDDLFGVFDTHGDLNVHDPGPEGLYFKDTRFLSSLRLSIGGRLPLLLGSVVLDDNGALTVDMTNADLHEAELGIWLPRDAAFLNRLKLLSGNVCYERLAFRRFEEPPRPIPVALAFDADFADLFEIRGEERGRRGEVRSEVLDARRVRFVYDGLDGITRSTTLHFDPAPERLEPNWAEWSIDLSEKERCVVAIKTACALGDPPDEEPPHHVAAFRAQRQASRRRSARLAGISSSNDLVNEVIARSASDLDMLLTQTEYGLYPYAGVPWYSTIFGRDGILTAMQLLWIAPRIARGVLHALALTQAHEADAEADSQPGKIVHEMRDGEMARLGEVPFRRYYGTVDATPLFVWLAGDYLKRTGDIAAIRSLWPNIEAARAWIDGPGDPDGDGFVEYQRATERGLANQGWKDSHDSIFHADGRMAEGPIALCEVQAYVYAAKRAAAAMALALGQPERAGELEHQAQALRQRFEDMFWLDDLGTYALALDGEKRPCRVRASNAGHALFGGIASPERAERVASLLTGREFFSGWGIRTLASGEPCYNPMSYHNGSVWPHDNALIALGCARYGHKEAVARIFEALLDPATYPHCRRLPELFGGAARGRRRGPTPYPVACSPQAWAAAAPFALIAASIGLELDHAHGVARVHHPRLPASINDLFLPNLHVGGSHLQMRFSQSGADVTTTVIDRHGPAEVVIIK
jgi:glycogen debranching enzyme